MGNEQSAQMGNQKQNKDRNPNAATTDNPNRQGKGPNANNTNKGPNANRTDKGNKKY